MTQDEQLKADSLYLRNHCLAMVPITEYDVTMAFSRAREASGTHSVHARLCMSHERLRHDLKGAEILIEAHEQEIKSLKERLKNILDPVRRP